MTNKPTDAGMADYIEDLAREFDVAGRDIPARVIRDLWTEGARLCKLIDLHEAYLAGIDMTRLEDFRKLAALYAPEPASCPSPHPPTKPSTTPSPSTAAAATTPPRSTSPP